MIDRDGGATARHDTSQRPADQAVWDEEHDVIVLGAGSGGLAAALVAALAGMRVLLVERSDQVGGTSAYSSGTAWVPDNAFLPELGVTNDAEEAIAYLDALVGDRANRALRLAFVAEGPRMVELLTTRTLVRFRPYRAAPDYRQELPGAGQGGRPLEPLPFDGRALGSDFGRIRPPIPEMTLFGGMMVTRAEAMALAQMWRSPRSVVLGARLILRYLRDRLSYPRGTRLVIGNALVARLFASLLAAGGEVRFETEGRELVVEDGRVVGLDAVSHHRPTRIRARRAVVLAGGGFPASAEMRERHLPRPTPVHTPAFAGSDGSTLRLGLAVGGLLGRANEDRGGLWFPSSIDTRRDGSTAVWPHIILDRAKPGIIAIDQTGRRFVNEATSYHYFVRAMYAAHRNRPTIPAWLVCDRAFVWRYGFGPIRPYTPSLRPFVRRGYLREGRTLEELARNLDVDPVVLAETVRTANEAARTGIDPEFGKGISSFDRSCGDPDHEPNPCLGPIQRAPFYALQLWPTPLGTSLGLVTDQNTRVLNAAGSPIPGLYACGNDMDSPFGGEYPGPGAEIGVALTFGYVAAREAEKDRAPTA